jgi:hypothetical protein
MSFWDNARVRSAFSISNRQTQQALTRAPARKYGLMHAIYLAAIFGATIGWLWLIAWIAMQMV